MKRAPQVGQQWAQREGSGPLVQVVGSRAGIEQVSGGSIRVATVTTRLGLERLVRERSLDWRTLVTGSRWRLVRCAHAEDFARHVCASCAKEWRP